MDDPDLFAYIIPWGFWGLLIFGVFYFLYGGFFKEETTPEYWKRKLDREETKQREEAAKQSEEVYGAHVTVLKDDDQLPIGTEE